MSKMRVYEYAKKLDVTSKEVIEQLNKLNGEVAKHMSSITAETIAKLDKSFNKGKNKQKEKVEQPKQQKNEEKRSNEQKTTNNKQPKRQQGNQKKQQKR